MPEVQKIPDLTITIATAKLKMPLDKVFILAVLAGAYIAIGALLAICVAAGDFSTTPGLQKLLFGGVFPLGLLLVVFAGAELFTGNTAILFPALLSKKIRWQSMLKHWGVVFLGNALGAILVAYFFAYKTEILQANPWHSFMHGIAKNKVESSFSVLFYKAIACNWLVCLALWMSFSVTNTTTKAICIWFAIMGFVAIGFEHSIANLFFVPVAIFYDAPISWSHFLYHNLLPVTLGNCIGASLLVATLYWYSYATKN